MRHLVRPVLHRVGGLEGLGGAGHVTVGKADDRADGELIAHVAPGPGHMAGRDAHAGAVVMDGLITQGSDLLAGTVDTQQRMVAFFKNVLQFHGIFSFFSSELMISLYPGRPSYSRADPE